MTEQVDPLSMHLAIDGFARLTVGLGDDGTVRLFWRVREARILEPEIQEVKFVDGKWVAGAHRGPLKTVTTESVPIGLAELK